jgi:hypothetical protein
MFLALIWWRTLLGWGYLNYKDLEENELWKLVFVHDAPRKVHDASVWKIKSWTPWFLRMMRPEKRTRLENIIWSLESWIKDWRLLIIQISSSKLMYLNSSPFAFLVTTYPWIVFRLGFCNDELVWIYGINVSLCYDWFNALFH